MLRFNINNTNNYHMCMTFLDFMQIVSALSAKANKGMLPMMNCIYCNITLQRSCLIKAKFHYAVQLASRSQTSSRPNSITLSSLRPAREQVCDQLATRELLERWAKTCVCTSYACRRPNSITLSSFRSAR